MNAKGIWVALSVLTICAGAVFGQAPGQPPAAGPAAPRQSWVEAEHRLLQWLANDPRAAEDLMLSAEQVQQLKACHLEMRKAIIELKAKMELAAVNQAELLDKEPLDEEAVMKAVEETGRLRTEIAKVSMRALLSVHRTLNADQRAKLKILVRHRLEAWRENRRQRGPGPVGTRPEPPARSGPPLDGPEGPQPPVPPE